uniref:isopentenyl-diphosphate Delta-isomerase n=1 Tax=Thaumasiovibrio occultus TaxID=1891184 RepID=UPI000B354531|nr:isopentenyl-diphosphate Delta-isomerase [Thaumasiovibrio occultus]
MSIEKVVLVAKDGTPVGLQEKMQAHLDGTLHLAFSVLLYREGKAGREYLLQQRALGKYHSGGLWTNTCCSHPRDGESMQTAGVRRLMEEMGIDYCGELDDVAQFIYRAELDNQLVEHELDHVLLGRVDTLDFTVNPEEVMASRWIPATEIAAELANSPQQYTAWFGTVFQHAEAAFITR